MTRTMEPPAANVADNGKSEHAIARRVNYQPLAPIGNAGALKQLLESQKDGVAQALPRHVTPERIIKTMLVAANRNPDILKCTQASVLETINRAAELGLDLSGTLGEAYPVPFNNKIKSTDSNGRTVEQWAMQLTLIIGYRGLEKLAWQSGEIEAIDAEVVCKNDEFKFRKGTEVLVEWSPCLNGDRGEVVGAYACVKMKSGGKLARFLPKSDIEKIRNSAKSKNSPAWANWWDEMARKCALKRTLKDAPLSTEKFVKAMEVDAEDYGLADVLAAQTGAPRGVSGVLQKITQRPVSENQTFEPDPAAVAQAEAEEQAADRLGPGAITEVAVSDPQEPDTRGVEAEPPTDAVPSPAEAFWITVREACEASGVDYETAGKAGVGKWALAKGVKGREHEASEADRTELIAAIGKRRKWFT